MKRSDDGGLHWSNLSVVISKISQPIGGFQNPVAVWDAPGKRVILSISRPPYCAKQHTTLQSLPGLSPAPPGPHTPSGCGANYEMISTDVGVSWSAPRALNRYLGSHYDSVAGPGAGIQLQHSDRVLFYLKHGAWEYGVAMRSDNHGVDYNVSNPIMLPAPSVWGMDEGQIVELWNGTIYATMRTNLTKSCACRGAAISTDR
jgi:hypothetical protein